MGKLRFVGVHVARLPSRRTHAYATTENAVTPWLLGVAGTRSHEGRHRLSCAIALPPVRGCPGSLRWRIDGFGASCRRFIAGPYAPACDVPGLGPVSLLISRFHPRFAEFATVAHGLIAASLLRIRWRTQQKDDYCEDGDPDKPAKNGGIMVPVPVQKNGK